MASPLNAALAALLAISFWTVLGYAVARHVLPRTLAIGASPVVGWAAFSAASLPVLTLVGFSAPAVIGVAMLGLLISGVLVLRPARPDMWPDRGPDMAPAVPPWSFAAAALLALVPAIAILPKLGADGGVGLSDPIFDHAKIALIDAMTRQGLPPVNPVFGEFGNAGRLAYYYLWHFSAAELALPLRVSGWEADIGLTWFTAFASLSLMMSLAVWLSKRPGAALLVVLLATAAAMRGTLDFLLHRHGLEPFLAAPGGFAGWLFQSAWVPQHLMAASCAVTAVLLIARCAERDSLARLLTLALIAAAGFESSAYVGGVTFALAALAAAPVLIGGVAPARRVRLVGGLALAAVLALALAAPFIRDQAMTVAAHRGGSPIVFHPFEVMGEMVPQALRRVLDLPAYWLVLLPIEFPAIYIAGTIAVVFLLRDRAAGPEKSAAAALLALAGAGLVIPWLLVGTLGDNNDLGLRAVLPAMMILTVATAVGMTVAPWRKLIVALALVGLIAGLPDAGWIVNSDIAGKAAPDAKVFAQAPELWDAVRRYAPPAARVGNNPLYLQDLTGWPVNVSWALLSDRGSCFAGREMVLAYAPMPSERREAINAQFIRVFAGQAQPGDVEAMAKQFSCDVMVVVPQDGAWSHDPFASSPEYRLAEFRADRWRIYTKTASDSDPR